MPLTLQPDDSAQDQGESHPDDERAEVQNMHRLYYRHVGKWRRIPAIRYPERKECREPLQVLMNAGSVRGKTGCVSAPPIAWSAISSGVWIGVVAGLALFRKTARPPRTMLPS